MTTFRTTSTANLLGLALAALALLCTRTAAAQEPSGLESFYGSQNLQYVTARVAGYLTPVAGNDFELRFGFDTSSKKTESADHWKYFYGVSLGGGGFFWPDTEIGDYEQRDITADYFFLSLENKVFYTTEGPILPFLGLSATFGTGNIWMERARGLPEPALPSMSLYGVGFEAGIQVPITDTQGLVLAVGVDATAVQFAADTQFYCPVMITVGWCQWRGPMP